MREHGLQQTVLFDFPETQFYANECYTVNIRLILRLKSGHFNSIKTINDKELFVSITVAYYSV